MRKTEDAADGLGLPARQPHTRMSPAVKWALSFTLVLLGILSGAWYFQPSSDPQVREIRYVEVLPVLGALSGPLPPALRQTSASSDPGEHEWHQWVSSHRTAIRERLQRGDEDSLVNFMLYGTTFTSLPRATPDEIGAAGQPTEPGEVLEGRLRDLLEGLRSPGTNERLQFGRSVLERRGIDPARTDAAREFVIAARSRLFRESERFRGRLQSAGRAGGGAEAAADYATVYRDRGLSSDTSLRIDFGIEQTLDALRTRGQLRPGSIHRVAVIGPGLDVTDKAQGYDFYPQQTIQPFAIMDSFARLGLATELHVTAFDVSPRVIQHLASARARAARGEPYVLHLPLSRDGASHEWHPDFVRYWDGFGAHLGARGEAVVPPGMAERVRMRAVHVRPSVVQAVTVRNLDVVLERLDGLPDSDKFDVVIATNVLVYYDAFEQALALTNLGSMLRSGGLLVTNHPADPPLPFESVARLVTSVKFGRRPAGTSGFAYGGETFFSYVRQ